MRFLRFLMKVCSFFFAIGLLSLFLGTINAIFGLGMWHAHGYPTLNYHTAPDGSQQNTPGDFWTFLWQFAALTVGLGIVGMILFVFVGDDDL